MANTLVLIAERDSRWAEWACAWRKPQHSLVLLVLGESSAEALCDRVYAHASHVRAGDACVVLLVAGQRWDGPALCARAQMIRAIAVRMGTLQRQVRLLVDAGPKDGPAGLGMEAIVEALAGTGVSAATQLGVVSNPRAVLRLAS